MFKGLKAKISEHQAMAYTLLVLFYIGVMQRLDRFVFWDLKLYAYPMPYRYWFWGILTLITVGFTVSNFLVARIFTKSYELLVLSIMLPWFCWAGVLDFMYFTDPPLVSWLWDPNYVWDWHPAYLFFGFPWTIVHQIPWAFCWLLGYYLLYRWAKQTP